MEIQKQPNAEPNKKQSDNGYGFSDMLTEFRLGKVRGNDTSSYNYNQ